MNDLAQSDEFPLKYKNLQSEAETNLTRRWANAAIWKWCDLDGHPHDRSVSLHELFPIKAPLLALEHCIAPFLESCDPDDNHRITLQEWGKCLQLDEVRKKKIAQIYRRKKKKNPKWMTMQFTKRKKTNQ